MLINESLPEKATIIIFGASGDLTQRKLVPALFSLYRKKRLPKIISIVGLSRSKMTDDGFRERMQRELKEFASQTSRQTEWETFAPNLHYIPFDLTEDDDYEDLSEFLSDHKDAASNRLYYLATAPRFFPEIITRLGNHGMTVEDNGWRRVVIEKPFGQDLVSAMSLNKTVHSVLSEKQIYRIDHFLAKETVQNILVFRFGNTIFEPIWNRNYIDHIQITATEKVDVGHRAGYYDQAGVLRDMFQNHLLQLLSLVSMEAPTSFHADALRNEKVKVFSAVRPFKPDQVQHHTVRGQYKGYQETPGVAPNSQTATYATLRVFIDNWRWQGVPFYLRSGKALKDKRTEIIIQFKSPPHMMFPIPLEQKIRANYLSLCIQPDEGIHLRFEAKVPDTAAEMRSVDMDFHYAESFGPSAIPEAYERLLLDALNGDAALFTRSDGIECAWSIIDPVLEGWGPESESPLAIYEPGSWGPSESDDLLAQSGHAWREGCGYH